jgi:hypothetical protein
MQIAESSGLRLLATALRLSLIGLTATLASAWVLIHEVDGSALIWVSRLAMLGAVVAVAAAMLAVRPFGDGAMRPPARA